MKPRIRHKNLPQLFLRARDHLMAHFRPILGHFELTDQQWRILRALDERGELEPRELCQLCQILSPSMAGVLLRMEEATLIQRERMPGDHRRVVVSLSKKGNQLIEGYRQNRDGKISYRFRFLYQYRKQPRRISPPLNLHHFLR